MSKTVKIRVAVAVDPQGDWHAVGWKDAHDPMSSAVETIAPGEARYWLTAELPIPEAVEVQAEIEDD